MPTIPRNSWRFFHSRQTLTTPTQALDDGLWPWEDLLLQHPKGEKKLQVKVVGPCCWYASVGQAALQVVLVRDPEGKWRDEALLSTALDLSAQEVIVGYVRRWSVEVAYADAKQMLGFHDPMVWCAASVERRTRWLGSRAAWWCCGMPRWGSTSPQRSGSGPGTSTR